MPPRRPDAAEVGLCLHQPLWDFDIASAVVVM